MWLVQNKTWPGTESPDSELEVEAVSNSAAQGVVSSAAL